MGELLTAPFLHTVDSTRLRMLDMAIALLPAAAGAIWYGGRHALALLALSVGTGVGLEWTLARLRRRPRPRDGSALVTGLLLALLLPFGAPWWAAVLGALAAIGSKALCGGLGRNWCDPAALGRAVLLAFPSLRPAPLRTVSGRFLMGYTGGSMAEVSSLLLLAGAGYLLLRRLLPLRIAAPALTASFLTALCIPGCDPLAVVAWGGTLFFVCFLDVDPVTSPMGLVPQAIYGAVCGVACTLAAYYAFGVAAAALALVLVDLPARLADRFF